MIMLKEIVGSAFGIYYIIYSVYIVLWNIGRIYKAVKCREVKKYCGQCTCCYNVCCEKYREIPTQKEIQALEDLLVEIKMTV